MLKVRDTVIYEARKDWGKGRVVSISNGMADIFFSAPGINNQILPVTEKFTKLKGKDAKEFILDAVYPAKLKEARPKNFKGSLEILLKKWPLGFNDPGFVENEITYKLKYQTNLKTLLGKEIFSDLLDQKEYSEIVKRALKIAQINLIDQHDTIPIIEPLKQEDTAKLFSVSLFNLLYDDVPYQERFTTFAKTVENIHPNHSWPITTLYSFLHDPSKFMFMKPDYTKEAAKNMNFELNYKSVPNWRTYCCLVQFADFIKEEASALGYNTRDYMDVQSFIYYWSNPY